MNSWLSLILTDLYNQFPDYTFFHLRMCMTSTFELYLLRNWIECNWFDCTFWLTINPATSFLNNLHTGLNGFFINWLRTRFPIWDDFNWKQDRAYKIRVHPSYPFTSVIRLFLHDPFSWLSTISHNLSSYMPNYTFLRKFRKRGTTFEWSAPKDEICWKSCKYNSLTGSETTNQNKVLS